MSPKYDLRPKFAAEALTPEQIKKADETLKEYYNVILPEDNSADIVRRFILFSASEGIMSFLANLQNEQENKEE